MSANPYAPPQASLDTARPSSTGGNWRIGQDILLVTRNSELPHRCVKCNAPASEGKKRTFYWHSRGWYALFLVSPVIYVITMIFVRRKVALSPRLCLEHRNKRTTRIVLSIGSFVGACLGGYAAAVLKLPVVAIVLFFGGIIGCLVFAHLASVIQAVGIDERGARFKGCGRAFLDSLEATRGY
jgi:hypothetical protein